jgi:hypothetical protein
VPLFGKLALRAPSLSLHTKPRKIPHLQRGTFLGAGDETQTRGLFLGKEALYQLSYTRSSESTVGFRKLIYQFSFILWSLLPHGFSNSQAE